MERNSGVVFITFDGDVSSTTGRIRYVQSHNVYHNTSADCAVP